MKALTVRQPWAWAVARGWKPVENRRWSTSYRGPLAIHAAQRWDDDSIAALGIVATLARADGALLPPTPGDDMPYTGVGLVIGVVDLVDICTSASSGAPCDCGAWASPGHTHWQLNNPRPLPEPFPATGRLGLWNLDDRLLPKDPS